MSTKEITQSVPVVILTDYGQTNIQNIHGLCVGVWNGHEFSTSQIQMTSVAEKLVTVTTDAGHELPCSREHKFYIQDGKGEEIEVRAGDLKGGEVLIKREFPVIPGVMAVKNAYEIGFNVSVLGSEPIDGKAEAIATCALVRDRLEWFAGLADGGGYLDTKEELLFVPSYVASFLRSTMLMLQTLGVFSRVTVSSDGRIPSCLTVDFHNVQILNNLGLSFRLIDWLPGDSPRDDEIVRIKEVIDVGYEDSVYCFTEHLRGKGTFNGIVTGH